MWKLAPASNTSHIFSEGDLIRLRSGTHVSCELTLIRLDNKKLIWREEGGKETYHGWARDAMTRGSMSEMGDFYGRTIDLWVEEKKELDPPNTRILVGKQFTKLVDGLRLVFVPYGSNTDRREYQAVVSVHTMGGIRNNEPVMQVHITREGKSFTTISFTKDLDNHFASELHLFDKFSCYWVKNYQKIVNGATKPAPEQDEDDDANGKYIIWCPTATQAPQRILKGRKQAKKVACEMSERHGKEFYWCRLMGKAEQEVVKTVSTKVISL